MNLRKLATSLLGACLLGLIQPGLAAAQDYPNELPTSGEAGSGRAPSGERRRAPPPPAEPTPAENLTAAQTLLTAAGSTCQATEASRIGLTVEQQTAFEVVCSGAPGQLVVASTPPKVYDCLELAGQALTTRENDATADVGQQCSLPVNTNAVPFVSAWAKEAGIACEIDEASAVGKTDAQAIIYEVGCANADGYWLSKGAEGWSVDACWDLALSGQKCRFTSTEEAEGAWGPVTAGTEAAACDVQQARRVGRDAQGLTVYELKCGAGGGYFVRVGADRVAQRAATCEASAHVAGGCTLTTATPAPPATEE